ncbi:MAG: carboxylating nicotinate-nucleotide diphosphorylase [Candidatus Omnitrophota bacterium]
MSSVNELKIKDIVAYALKEDIGSKDITTQGLIPADKFVKAQIIVKEDCIVCGLRIASLAFKIIDKDIKFKILAKDGDFVKKGRVIAQVCGRARNILIAERVALNFLCLLCGISTKVKSFVNTVKPRKVKIMDTRKTIPCIRALEKYAVRIGGGFNHRMSLSDMILVKDNHLRIIGGIGKLKQLSHKHKIEIEVENLKDFLYALKLKPDIIMLDNMNIKDIRKAVLIRNSLTPKLEASGGIHLQNVKQFAATGVDMISIGALTHSVKSIDISLEVLRK